jgi:FtsZ-interacting cell division protein ZipA
MGRLLIFVGIIVIAAIILGVLWLALSNQEQRAKMGLQSSKKRMVALQTQADIYRGTLEEIQSIADTSVVTGSGDPMWDLVLGKINDVLHNDNDGK